MNASWEELCDADTRSALVRIHEDGFTFGDAYSWAVVVRYDGSQAVLEGAVTSPKPAEVRALLKILRDKGFTKLSWERRSQDDIRTKSHEI